MIQRLKEASDQAGVVEAKSQPVEVLERQVSGQWLSRLVPAKRLGGDWTQVTQAVRGGDDACMGFRTRVFGVREGAWPSTDAQRSALDSQPAPCRRPLKNYVSRWPCSPLRT